MENSALIIVIGIIGIISFLGLGVTISAFFGGEKGFLISIGFIVVILGLILMGLGGYIVYNSIF